MEPVRKIQACKYFREVNVNGRVKFMPVEDSEGNSPGVRQMSLADIKNDDLEMPKVCAVRGRKSVLIHISRKTLKRLSKKQSLQYRFPN